MYICFDFSESEERSESAGEQSIVCYIKTITFLDIYIKNKYKK